MRKFINYLKYFTILILTFWTSIVICQNGIDSFEELKIKQLSLKADSLFKASNYSAAIKTYLQLADLYIDKFKWEDAINSYFQIASSYQVKGSFDSSLYFINNSHDLIVKNQINSELLLGKYYFIKGTTYNKLGQNDSALMSLNLSMKYLSAGINDSILVLVKRSLGNIHFLSGNLDIALEQYYNALKIEKNRNHPSEIMLAAIFQNIGIVYSTSSNYDSAYPYLTKSIELKEKTLDKDDPQLAIGFMNYGRFLFLTGFPNQALQYYSKAEEIYYTKFGKNYFGLAPIYFNKGSLFIQLRDYNKALNYHEQALEIYKLNKVPIITDLIMNLGVIYNELGDYTKAIGYFKQSIKESENPALNVKAFKNLAKCYYNLDDTAQAITYYQLSIKESEEFLGSNHFLTAGSYNAFGVFYMNIKDYKKAEGYLLKAYQVWMDINAVKNQEISLILSDLGDLYYNLEDIDKALNYYQKAIISKTKSFNIENIYKNPKIEDLEPEFNTFVFLYKKTQALYDKYLSKTKNAKDLEASYNTSVLAIKLFESISASYKDDNTKLQINEYIYDIYNTIVLIAAELHDITKDKNYLNSAFEYSEKGKAAVLLSSIRGLEAMEIGNIPSKIRKEEQNISNEITILKNLINDENQKVTPDSLKLSSWKRNLFEITIRYDSVIRFIEDNYPEYYNFKYNFNVIKTGEVQDNLIQNQVFVEYKLIDSTLFIFSISKDTIMISKEFLDNDFMIKLKDFISYINKYPGESVKRENYIEFIYNGNYLYKTLLSFLDPSMKDCDLIIIPDNILGLLAFESLITHYQVPEKLDFKNLNYLIKSHTVYYNYSGTIHFKQSKDKKNNKKLLAMAPLYKQANTDQAFNLERNRGVYQSLTPLLFSEDEVNNILTIFSGMKLTGTDATESNFKTVAGTYKILHFAMHTLIDDEDPLQSKLVFTQNNDSVEDGFLNVYEIYNLNLNAELAVLSACKTGSGELLMGEGIMSLARGFLYAGVPSIVLTLWEIEDASGSEIMLEFYRNLLKGKPADKALRNAKLTYLESANQLESHPYFWAAYIQIGHNKPVSANIYLKYTIYTGIVVSIIGLFLLLRRMKKKTLN